MSRAETSLQSITQDLKGIGAGGKKQNGSMKRARGGTREEAGGGEKADRETDRFLYPQTVLCAVGTALPMAFVWPPVPFPSLEIWGSAHWLPSPPHPHHCILPHQFQGPPGFPTSVCKWKLPALMGALCLEQPWHSCRASQGWAASSPSIAHTEGWAW